jgi:translation initiation factor 1
LSEEPHYRTGSLAAEAFLADHFFMSDRDNARIVYSSSGGRICPRCGWPVDRCQCSSRNRTESVPSKVVVRLRLETKGRGGKAVSVVDGFPRNDAFLRELCQELKRACGSGGTVSDTAIELQGDQRERLRDVLSKKGFTVKG